MYESIARLIFSSIFCSKHRDVNSKSIFFCYLPVKEVGRGQKLGFKAVFTLLLQLISEGDYMAQFTTNNNSLCFYQKVSRILKITLLSQGQYV